MRAMAVTAYGEPLAPIDVTEPDVRDGHALLAVEACGVCSSDLKTARGLMPFSDDLVLPHVPGHEIAGRVMATNPQGSMPDGALVAVFHYWPCGRCAACRRGDETLCSALDAWVGFTDPGGFQRRLAVPVDRLVPIPDGIGAAHAAPMTCALGTAYRAVVTRGRVDAGTRVVVIGLGGVGIHAAQIAVAAGAQVTGVDRHAASAALAADLGLDVHRDAEAAKQALLDATSGEGVDVVIDTVGHADALALAADMTREGGRVVGVGYSPSEHLRSRRRASCWVSSRSSDHASRTATSWSGRYGWWRREGCDRSWASFARSTRSTRSSRRWRPAWWSVERWSTSRERCSTRHPGRRTGCRRLIVYPISYTRG